MADVKAAQKLLEKASTDCKSAKDIADGYGNYSAAKRRAAEDREKINKLPADRKAPLTKELESIDKQLESATAKAKIEKKPQEALPKLQQVQRDLDQANLKLDMQSNLNSPAPNPEFIKLLAKQPGGQKMLDDMVAQMSDSTPRNVLEAALEARFVNIDLQQHLSKNWVKIGTPPKDYHGTADNTAPDKSVKRIYELLLKVPESHAGGNPSINLIRRFQEDTGGASYNASGKIDLNCGRAGATTSPNQAAQLGSPEYFPDGVDPDCQPPDDAKQKEVLYFDWATLHEVGHAVDEKNQFMKANQKDDAFGGWEVYDADVTTVAEAAQKEFKYDLNYIKKRLQRSRKKRKPTDPAPMPIPAAAKPSDRDKKEWEEAKKKVDAWTDLVMGLNLWWDGEACKRAAIGGRVYHLSYDWPEWVSYKLEARKKGIHGYQFRAPGEWFAELYAAYYMGMLKPEHPAVKDWLPGKLA